MCVRVSHQRPPVGHVSTSAAARATAALENRSWGGWKERDRTVGHSAAARVSHTRQFFHQNKRPRDDQEAKEASCAHMSGAALLQMSNGPGAAGTRSALARNAAWFYCERQIDIRHTPRAGSSVSSDPLRNCSTSSFVHRRSLSLRVDVTVRRGRNCVRL